MKAFAQLILRLDESKSDKEKIGLLMHYFQLVNDDEAAWALWLLLGNRFPKVVSIQNLQDWCREISGIPDWLFQESYDLVSDKLETVSLLIGNENILSTPNLNYTINEKIIPLNQLTIDERKLIIIEYWSQLDSDSIYIYNKLLTAGFRSGLSIRILSMALAPIASVPEAVMMHRLHAGFNPTQMNYSNLLTAAISAADSSKPYPFQTLHAFENKWQEVDSDYWLAEWNWQGVRVQVIKRSDQLFVWSEKEEWMQGSFPELESDLLEIPFDFVIEGKIVAGNNGISLPTTALYKRLSTKQTGRNNISETPLRLIATDILELNREDIRKQTLLNRKKQLYSIIPNDSVHIQIGPVFSGLSWEELARLRNSADSQLYDGLLLKRIHSDYLNEEAQVNGLLWKKEPFWVLAVLTYAQRAQTQAAGIYSEFSFAVWENDELRTIAKTTIDLSESERLEVNQFIQTNKLEKFGPVHTVKPALVFEISFEGVQESRRHKTGLLLIAPKVVKWRRDLSIEDADILDFLRAML